jgi:hypothetical protein
MVYLWSTTLLVGVSFQILIIATLLRGGWRSFRVLFVYCVVLLLTTVLEASAFYNPEIWNRTTSYYWIVDAVRQILIFCVVISLIHAAMPVSRKQAAVRRGLIAGAVVIAGLSLYFPRDFRFGVWMTAVSRNVGFYAVILNLILWAVLVQSRRADHTLLMVSGGMGIQMAGKAIGHSLRQLNPYNTVAGDLVIVLSHLVCLYVWWQVFRRFEMDRGSTSP